MSDAVRRQIASATRTAATNTIDSLARELRQLTADVAQGATANLLDPFQAPGSVQSANAARIKKLEAELARQGYAMRAGELVPIERVGELPPQPTLKQTPQPAPSQPVIDVPVTEMDLQDIKSSLNSGDWAAAEAVGSAAWEKAFEDLGGPSLPKGSPERISAMELATEAANEALKSAAGEALYRQWQGIHTSLGGNTPQPVLRDKPNKLPLEDKVTSAVNRAVDGQRAINKREPGGYLFSRIAENLEPGYAPDGSVVLRQTEPFDVGALMAESGLTKSVPGTEQFAAEVAELSQQALGGLAQRYGLTGGEAAALASDISPNAYEAQQALIQRIYQGVSDEMISRLNASPTTPGDPSALRRAYEFVRDFDKPFGGAEAPDALDPTAQQPEWRTAPNDPRGVQPAVDEGAPNKPKTRKPDPSAQPDPGSNVDASPIRVEMVQQPAFEMDLPVMDNGVMTTRKVRVPAQRRPVVMRDFAVTENRQVQVEGPRSLFGPTQDTRTVAGMGMTSAPVPGSTVTVMSKGGRTRTGEYGQVTNDGPEQRVFVVTMPDGSRKLVDGSGQLQGDLDDRSLQALFDQGYKESTAAVGSPFKKEDQAATVQGRRVAGLANKRDNALYFDDADVPADVLQGLRTSGQQTVSTVVGDLRQAFGGGYGGPADAAQAAIELAPETASRLLDQLDRLDAVGTPGRKGDDAIRQALGIEETQSLSATARAKESPVDRIRQTLEEIAGADPFLETSSYLGDVGKPRGVTAARNRGVATSGYGSAAEKVARLRGRFSDTEILMAFEGSPPEVQDFVRLQLSPEGPVAALADALSKGDSAARKAVNDVVLASAGTNKEAIVERAARMLQESSGSPNDLAALGVSDAERTAILAEAEKSGVLRDFENAYREALDDAEFEASIDGRTSRFAGVAREIQRVDEQKLSGVGVGSGPDGRPLQAVSTQEQKAYTPGRTVTAVDLGRGASPEVRALIEEIQAAAPDQLDDLSDQVDALVDIGPDKRRDLTPDERVERLVTPEQRNLLQGLLNDRRAELDRAGVSASAYTNTGRPPFRNAPTEPAPPPTLAQKSAQRDNGEYIRGLRGVLGETNERRMPFGLRGAPEQRAGKNVSTKMLGGVQELVARRNALEMQASLLEADDAAREGLRQRLYERTLLDPSSDRYIDPDDFANLQNIDYRGLDPKQLRRQMKAIDAQIASDVQRAGDLSEAGPPDAELRNNMLSQYLYGDAAQGPDAAPYEVPSSSINPAEQLGTNEEAVRKLVGASASPSQSMFDSIYESVLSTPTQSGSSFLRILDPDVPAEEVARITGKDVAKIQAIKQYVADTGGLEEAVRQMVARYAHDASGSVSMQTPSAERVYQVAGDFMERYRRDMQETPQRPMPEDQPAPVLNPADPSPMSSVENFIDTSIAEIESGNFGSVADIEAKIAALKASPGGSNLAPPVQTKLAELQNAVLMAKRSPPTGDPEPQQPAYYGEQPYENPDPLATPVKETPDGVAFKPKGKIAADTSTSLPAPEEPEIPAIRFRTEQLRDVNAGANAPKLDSEYYGGPVEAAAGGPAPPSGRRYIVRTDTPESAAYLEQVMQGRINEGTRLNMRMKAAIDDVMQRTLDKPANSTFRAKYQATRAIPDPKKRQAALAALDEALLNSPANAKERAIVERMRAGMKPEAMGEGTGTIDVSLDDDGANRRLVFSTRTKGRSGIVTRPSAAFSLADPTDPSSLTGDPSRYVEVVFDQNGGASTRPYEPASFDDQPLEPGMPATEAEALAGVTPLAVPTDPAPPPAARVAPEVPVAPQPEAPAAPAPQRRGPDVAPEGPPPEDAAAREQRILDAAERVRRSQRSRNRTAGPLVGLGAAGLLGGRGVVQNGGAMLAGAGGFPVLSALSASGAGGDTNTTATSPEEGVAAADAMLNRIRNVKAARYLNYYRPLPN